MSTRTWSAPATSRSASSMASSAGAACGMKRLPARLTTPSVTPSRSTIAVPRPGWVRRKLAGRTISRRSLEVRPDLAVPVGVVAERDDVGPGGEQLVGVLRRDADAARGVLAVDDDEVGARAPRAASASIAWATRRPAEPTTSPTNRIAVGVERGAYAYEDAADRTRRIRSSWPHASAPPSEPAARARGSSPVVVPRWIQLVTLPLAILGGYALLRAAGPVTLLFVVAALHRAAAQPVRRAAPAARALPRGLAVLTRLPRADRDRRRPRRGARGPDRRPGRRLHGRGPRRRRRRQRASSATCSAGSTTTGSTSRSRRQGQTALETLGERVAEGSGELVSFTREALHDRDRGRDRADPDHRPVRLHAALRASGSARWSARRPARGRHAGRRLPDARAARRLRLRPRAAPVLDRSWARARGSRCGSWASLGIFPDGKTYALVFGAWFGFAELIPYIGPAIGARPARAARAVLRRSARRAVADDHVHGAAADRGPHRRPAGLLARPCGSTRCW